MLAETRDAKGLLGLGYTVVADEGEVLIGMPGTELGNEALGRVGVEDKGDEVESLRVLLAHLLNIPHQSMNNTVTGCCNK